jgi:menaquinone-specific isochorismate synthase
MAPQSVEFSKQEFLKQGGIFAYFQELWLFWGEPQWLSHPPSGPALYAPDFFLKSKTPWLHFPQAMAVTKEFLDEQLNQGALSLDWELPDPSLFQAQWDWAQERFAKKELNKVVPYLFEKTQIPLSPQLIEGRLKAALAQSRGYLYGYWNQERAIMGLTPEVLIHQHNSTQLSTMAVAGTLGLAEYKNHPECLIQNPKEIEEHQWVVQDICDAIKDVAQVKVGERSVQVTPTLAHLYTPIELTCDWPLDIESWVRRLHPTAALGASPRGQTWTAMETLEKLQSRHWLGAPLGMRLSDHKALVLVAIRHWHWQEGVMYVGAGCGVVPQSHAEREWNELIEKRQSIKKIFAL